MRELAGFCALLLVSGLAVLVWMSAGDVSETADGPTHATATAIDHDAPSASSTAVPTEPETRPNAAAPRIPVATDRPGARVRGRLRLGDAALANARIEVWRRPFRDALPTRVSQLHTDADGGFEASRLDAERHVIAVDDERVPLATVVAEITLGANALLELGELVIWAPGELAARAVDEAGLPMADVRVTLAHREWSKWGPELALGLAGGEAGRALESRTDGEGFVRFLRLPPGGSTLLFDAPEFLPRTRYGEIVEREPTDLGVVKLTRGRRLDGRILDWTGAPVAGARVAKYARTSVALPAPRLSITDSEGRFVLQGMPTSQVPTLAIEAEGQVPIVCDDYAAAGVAEIRLPRAFWITGKVHGAPASATRVQVDEAEGSDNQIPDQSLRRLLGEAHEVAADGSFRVGPILPGEWKLWAEAGAHGFSPPVDVVIADADLALDLEVPQRARIEVVVRGADGRPVVGARIGWLDGENGAHPELDREPDSQRVVAIFQMAERSRKLATTDAAGGARLAIDLDRPFAIAVYCEGGWAEGRGFVDGQRPERIEFVIAASGGIDCKIEGDDAASVNVTAYSISDRQHVFRGRHVGKGMFEIRPVPVGRYRVQVFRGSRSHDRGALVQPRKRDGELGTIVLGLDEEIEVSAAATAQCAIRLPTPGRLQGVVHSRGRPIADCQVFARAIEDDAGSRTDRARTGDAIDLENPSSGANVVISGEDGSYGFDVLAPGAWQIYVRHPRGHLSSGPWPVRFVQPGQKVIVDPRLGAARIAIAVDPQWLRAWPERGRPESYLVLAETARSDAFRSSERGSRVSAMRRATFDSEGRAAFEFLPAGAYVLRIGVDQKRVLWQRGLVIGTDEDVELGPLTAPTSHVIEVPLETPPLPESRQPVGSEFVSERRLGVVVHALFDEIETPSFVLRAQVQAGRVKLELPAGRYEIRAECVAPLMFGSVNDPIGAAAELVVHSDGAFEPKLLDLR